MGKRRVLGRVFGWIVLVGLAAAAGWGYHVYYRYANEQKILKQMISRLEADSRIAQVVVTNVSLNPVTHQRMTTIKFLEYDTKGRPMKPKYFTFSGDIIQFESLVVRFSDMHVAMGDKLRGKSAYLFWKVFHLAGKNTQEYEITPVGTIPAGYKVDGPQSAFERDLWRHFWDYALNSDRAIKKGIKNAQIEAPGSKFVPGVLYTLKIEHDGGIRIDTQKIPDILRGEKVLN